MSFWVLTQILINLILLAGVVILWLKLNRPQKDDPRLSRGLQLLQSKISVLEDLSDRTETQVSQLNTLMENKCKEIQEYIIKADHQLQKIESSMHKSKEVAKIFQDKIPHEEIIERQNTLKYVKAARLAHEGKTVQEISQETALPMGEVEFIAKLNREQLQFSEESLPEWAQEENAAPVLSPLNEELSPATPLESPKMSLENLGEQFRRAQNQPTAAATVQPKSTQRTNTTTIGIQKVVFPRVEPNNNLG